MRAASDHHREEHQHFAQPHRHAGLVVQPPEKVNCKVVPRRVVPVARECRDEVRPVGGRCDWRDRFNPTATLPPIRSAGIILQDECNLGGIVPAFLSNRAEDGEELLLFLPGHAT